MACIEHRCFNCEWVYMDNSIRDICPRCKSVEVSNWSDEIEIEDSLPEEED